MNNEQSKFYDKLIKLEELFSNTVDREEVAKTVKVILESIDVLKDQIKADIESRHENMQKNFEKLNTLIKNAENNANSGTSRVKDGLVRDIKETATSLRQEINTLRSEIPELPDFSFLDKKLMELQAKIPSITDLENKIPVLGIQIRDGLELLTGDERLDKSAIKGLEDIEKDITNLKNNKGNKTIYTGTGGSSSGGRNVQAYDLSSQLNGVLKTFTIPAFWRVISVHSTSFPFVFRPTVDYTTNGSTITFTSEITADTTLAAGQTIIIIYAE